MSEAKPMSANMNTILETVRGAKGEISGWSIAMWLNKSRYPEGVREGLKALTRRGVIIMRPMDDPSDEFRKQFPDRLKALYSTAKAEGR